MNRSRATRDDRWRRVSRPFRRWRQTRPYGWWLAASTQWASRRYNGQFDDLRFFCLFLGHGRSGHSLVAALYDAHPQVVMADEIDSLRLVGAGFSQAQLFAYIAGAAARHASHGRRKTGGGDGPYTYEVPGQWQGCFQTARVIGEASLATTRLYDDPLLLDRLHRLVRRPVRLIQVVRNPYDSISRLHLVSGRPLTTAVDHYFSVCRRTAVVRRRLGPGDILLLRHETLIKAPDEQLETMLAFVGLDAPSAYRAACAGILFKQPKRVRDRIAWPTALIDTVADQAAAYDFLAGYTYDA